MAPGRVVSSPLWAYCSKMAAFCLMRSESFFRGCLRAFESSFEEHRHHQSQYRVFGKDPDQFECDHFHERHLRLYDAKVRYRR